MKQVKIYECIIDLGNNEIVKDFFPAWSKNDMLKEWGGNGEFIRIKDVTDEYSFDLSYLMDCMSGKDIGHWGQTEQDIIRRVLALVLKNAVE